MIVKHNTRTTGNTKPKNDEEIEVRPSRQEGEKSSGQTVIRETPEYEIECMTHESTIEAIVEIAREVINTLGTTAKTSKQQAVQKLCDMITHLEELQVETEVTEE